MKRKTAGGEGSSIAAAKRRRGRIPGSKNKLKFPATTTPYASGFHPHVLEVHAGGNVAKTIAAFVHGCRAFGVCVLTASGPVSMAVVWEASPYPTAALAFRGHFDLLSISATFLPGGEGSMTVRMAGQQGQVMGGVVAGPVVAGPVVAAGTVIVVVATFVSDPDPGPTSMNFDAMKYEMSASELLFAGGGSMAEEERATNRSEHHHEEQILGQLHDLMTEVDGVPVLEVKK